MKKWFIVIFLFLQTISLFSMHDEWENLANTEGSIASAVKWKTAKELVGYGLGYLKPHFEYTSRILTQAETKGSKPGLVLSSLAVGASGIYFVSNLLNYIKQYKILSKKFVNTKKILEKTVKQLENEIKATLASFSGSAEEVNLKTILQKLLKNQDTDKDKVIEKLIENKDTKKLIENFRKEYISFILAKKQFEKNKSFIRSKAMLGLILLLGSGALVSIANFSGLAGNAFQYLMSKGIGLGK